MLRCYDIDRLRYKRIMKTNKTIIQAQHLSSHHNAMLIPYYVCIYIIKRAIKYMGTARDSHDSVKPDQLS